MVANGRTISDEALIVVKDAAAAYGGGDHVYQGISFTIRKGEIFFIAGNSGAGKSTLLRQMIGLQPLAEGTIEMLGKPVIFDNVGPELTREFGVAFQGGALFGSRTVAQNVQLPLEQFTRLPRDLIEDVAITKLRLVGLEHAAHKLPSELSGGMQKRAALARALAMDPKVVFLDEPSAGLDPLTSAALDTLIQQLNNVLGTTFVVVSHELASIFEIADRVALISASAKGLVALDEPAKLREGSKDPWVRSFFNRGVLSTRVAVSDGRCF